ncbi:hypothetical protein LTR15_001845 [Elasticomyces elasticus]|nr:hypothetical protein LTR15_001845 [Elasticomyces elasticus]
MGFEQLPPELRWMIYDYLFQPYPCYTYSGTATHAVPAILQADPHCRRSDFKSYFMNDASEVNITLDGDSHPTALAAWSDSEVDPEIAVIVHFKTLHSLTIEWLHEPPRDEYLDAFEDVLLHMEQQTPNEEELVKLFQLLEYHWCYWQLTRSNKQIDEPVGEYGEFLMLDSDLSGDATSEVQTLLLGLGGQSSSELADHFMKRLSATAPDSALRVFVRECLAGEQMCDEEEWESEEKYT